MNGKRGGSPQLSGRSARPVKAAPSVIKEQNEISNIQKKFAKMPENLKQIFGGMK